MDKRSIIHSGIPTPYIKQVAFIPFGNEHQYRKNLPLYSGSSLITDDRKLYKLKSHTYMPSKDKESTPYSQ